MELSTTNIIAIFVVIDIIILIIVLTYISRKRRRKQEEEMNSYNTFSSISKPKVTEKKETEPYKYKFSIETGEEIKADKTNETTGNESDDIFSLFESKTDSEITIKVEENLDLLDLSDTQKGKIMEKLKSHLAEKLAENQPQIDEKITIIEDSKLTEAQKEKVIEFLKNQKK
jgi:hypothetical protein